MLDAHLVLQGRETYEAQEELSSRGHGHGRVHAGQAVGGPRQALPQAQDGLTWRGEEVQIKGGGDSMPFWATYCTSYCTMI